MVAWWVVGQRPLSLRRPVDAPEKLVDWYMRRSCPVSGCVWAKVKGGSLYRPRTVAARAARMSAGQTFSNGSCRPYRPPSCGLLSALGTGLRGQIRVLRLGDRAERLDRGVEVEEPLGEPADLLVVALETHLICSCAVVA